MVQIERIVDRRSVIWESNTKSKVVKLEPGAVFSIYLPASFAGSTLSFEALESRPGESPEVWAEFYVDNAGTSELLTVAVTAGKRNHLPDEMFAGLDYVRFVSDASEAVTGKLSMNA